MNKLISEENKYTGKRFKIIQRIYEREDGLNYIRDCVEPGNSVIILPINEENEIIFEEQFREAINKLTLELPAGMIDIGESPEVAAKRELEEETGILANKIEFLMEYYPSAGYTNEKVYIFVAKNFQKGKIHLDQTEEILSIKKIDFNKCLKMALNVEFEHASINLAILMYYFKEKNGGKDGRN